MKDDSLGCWRRQKNRTGDTHLSLGLRNYQGQGKGKKGMKLKEKIEELAATGYILLWLLGVPIPVLLLFFLLRGCT
jgi:hypothetical protein